MRCAELDPIGCPSEPSVTSLEIAGPTMNHVPPRIANQAPSTVIARLRAMSSSRPPTNTAAPGATSYQPRAAVQCQALSGVNAKVKVGPTNGARAPQAPNNTSSTPLAAPRVRDRMRVLGGFSSAMTSLCPVRVDSQPHPKRIPASWVLCATSRPRASHTEHTSSTFWASISTALCRIRIGPAAGRART